MTKQGVGLTDLTSLLFGPSVDCRCLSPPSWRSNEFLGDQTKAGRGGMTVATARGSFASAVMDLSCLGLARTGLQRGQATSIGGGTMVETREAVAASGRAAAAGLVSDCWCSSPPRSGSTSALVAEFRWTKVVMRDESLVAGQG
ncbi:hypothetical protein Droror1_Dr00025613 [Drosera rotundifolia]